MKNEKIELQLDLAVNIGTPTSFFFSFFPYFHIGIQILDNNFIMSTEEGSLSNFVHIDEEPVLSGYLHKKTRDGRWQRRWFETNGVYLTYYKVIDSSF